MKMFLHLFARRISACEVFCEWGLDKKFNVETTHIMSDLLIVFLTITGFHFYVTFTFRLDLLLSIVGFSLSAPDSN